MQESNQPSPPDRDKTALLAYQLWEKNGRPAGQDVRFWLQAEQILRSSLKAPIQTAPPLAQGVLAQPAKSPTRKVHRPKAKKNAAKTSGSQTSPL